MRRPIQHPARTLLVSLLILALVPTPWPKVEFHNVRHQDEAGQVCPYHEHLLRWHPSAPSGEEVAVLHWHWAWPSEPSEPSDAADLGPYLHAPTEDLDQATAALTAPVAVDTSPRSLVAPPALEAASPAFFLLPPLASHLLPSRSRSPRALTFSATFAPRASLTARLHRWAC